MVGFISSFSLLSFHLKFKTTNESVFTNDDDDGNYYERVSEVRQLEFGEVQRKNDNVIQKVVFFNVNVLCPSFSSTFSRLTYYVFGLQTGQSKIIIQV